MSGSRTWDAASFAVMLLVGNGGWLVAQGDRPPLAAGTRAVADLDLEDLLAVEVTSVAKSSQKLTQSPAAVTVVTGEEIRRSGFTSIPEALRLVPGLHVARIMGNRWSISARGFGGEFTNKLLVLIDGRAVYTPLFGGVYWDVQDTMLADVDRIEVIRGPGGVMWGANAVNGVINVITKSAKDTTGGLAYGGAGSEERGMSGFRFGSQFGENDFYRVYAKYADVDEFVDARGNRTGDEVKQLRTGFRTDLDPTDRGGITISGDVYRGDNGEQALVPIAAAPYVESRALRTAVEGGNLTARWRDRGADGAESSVQTYVDFTDRTIATIARERRATFDVEAQHAFAPRAGHSLLIGAGYRATVDDLDTSIAIDFTDRHETDQVFTAFAHDAFDLVTDTLRLSFGAKVELNDYTGVEVQPDARLVWQVSDKMTTWTSVARAVRTPTRADDSIRADLNSSDGGGGLAAMGVLLGNPDLDAEELLAFEAGWRWQASQPVALDLALFYNEYDNLMTIGQGTPYFEAQPRPRIVVPLQWRNAGKAQTYGGEVSANVQVSPGWLVSGHWSVVRVLMQVDDAAAIPTTQDPETDTPRHQIHLRSQWRIGEKLDIGALAWWTDRSHSQTARLDDFVRVDLRLGWRPEDNIELSLVGQNLVGSSHAEGTADLYTVPGEVERGVYFQVTSRF